MDQALARLNELRAEVDKPPLKTWRLGMIKLRIKIMNLERDRETRIAQHRANGH